MKKTFLKLLALLALALPISASANSGVVVPHRFGVTSPNVTTGLFEEKWNVGGTTAMRLLTPTTAGITAPNVISQLGVGNLYDDTFASSRNHSVVFIKNEFTNLTSTAAGLSVTAIQTPSGGNNSGVTAGIRTMGVANGGARNISTVSGITSSGLSQSVGTTLTNLNGATNSSTLDDGHNANVTNMNGTTSTLNLSAEGVGDGGTVSNGTGHLSTITKTTGDLTTLTLARGYHAQSFFSSAAGGYRAYSMAEPTGTPGVVYGIYIPNLTTGSSDTGIYVEGADTYAIFSDAGLNRFDGNTAISTGAAPGANTVLMIGSGATNATNTLMSVGFTSTVTSGSPVLVDETLTINPSSASSALYTGSNRLTTTSTNLAQDLGTIIGSSNTVTVDLAAADATTVTASSNFAQFEGAAITTLRAVRGVAQITSGGGDGTTVSGVQGDVNNLGAGTISSAISLHAMDVGNTGGGAVTTGYGLRVESQTSGTTNYGVWIGGATSGYTLYTDGGDVNFNGGALLLRPTATESDSAIDIVFDPLGAANGIEMRLGQNTPIAVNTYEGFLLELQLAGGDVGTPKGVTVRAESGGMTGNPNIFAALDGSTYGHANDVAGTYMVGVSSSLESTAGSATNVAFLAVDPGLGNVWDTTLAANDQDITIQPFALLDANGGFDVAIKPSVGLAGNTAGGDTVFTLPAGQGTGRQGVLRVAGANDDVRWKMQGTGRFHIEDSASTDSLEIDHDGTNAIYDTDAGVHQFNQGIDLTAASGSDAIKIQGGQLTANVMTDSPSAGGDGYLATFDGVISEAESGTHSILANQYISIATVIPEDGTVTNTASLYIEGSLTATVTGANYTIFSDAGVNRFDGTVQLGAASGGTGLLNFKGNTSGTVGLTVGAAAGTYSLTLPSALGTAGDVLYDTDGGGTLGWKSVDASSSGTYTPTRSAEANMDSNVTMTEAQYMRVGNTVTVSGRFTADPTLTATTTSFEITLPVASDLGAAEDAAGVAFCGNIVAQGAEVIGVAANNTAKVQFKSGDVTSQAWSFTFTYQVL